MTGAPSTTAASHLSLRRVACLLLCMHVLLLAYAARSHAPLLDEPAHVYAGVAVWQSGSHIFLTNPPLIDSLAALPLCLTGPEVRIVSSTTEPWMREQWEIASRCVATDAESALKFIALGRWVSVLFSVCGAICCWRWAGELYGATGGLLALSLWTFSPNVIAWGATATNDLPAAVTGVIAAFSFWTWRRDSTWRNTVATGVALGTAEMTKFTWIFLYLLWPLLWLLLGPLMSVTTSSRRPAVRALQIVCIMLLSIAVVTVGYGGRGFCRRLDSYQFVSSALSGRHGRFEVRGPGNRFAGTLLGALPVPLPEPAVTGIDIQRCDFEEAGPVYANGVWRDGGYWYWYLEAYLMKEPLGTVVLCLGACAGAAACLSRRGIAALLWSSRSAPHRSNGGTGFMRCLRGGELVIIAHAACVLILISSNHSLVYFRYGLACLPFAFIWSARIAVDSGHQIVSDVPTRAGHSNESGTEVHPIPSGLGHMRRVSIVMLSVWSSVSSLLVMPHAHSFYSEIAGGAFGGHRYLIGDCSDWGQDLLALRTWYRLHPEARPLHADLVAPFEPNLIGLNLSDCLEVPLRRTPDGHDPLDGRSKIAPAPGWYAISVSRIHAQSSGHRYLLEHAKPVATIGYSIYVYNLGTTEANKVRQVFDDG